MLGFLSVVILCGLIYATLNTKSNEILNEIREFKREMYGFARGNQRSLDVFQKEIETLKELVGEQPPLNDVKCIDCEYLELELPYAVCSKAYKGIVAPDDSCGKGKLKEMVGEDNASKD